MRPETDDLQRPVNIARLALALHEKGVDDCGYLYGHECDCGWARRLTEAVERYNSPDLRPDRDEPEGD